MKGIHNRKICVPRWCSWIKCALCVMELEAGRLKLEFEVEVYIYEIVSKALLQAKKEVNKKGRAQVGIYKVIDGDPRMLLICHKPSTPLFS